ncbi:MAG: lipoyl synthase [Planctomycetota bacterium]|jgi:lipoic acid synthetase
MRTKTPLPPWLKKPLYASEQINRTKNILAQNGVPTVCQHAKCPNLNQCWSQKIATFMILGDRCTRRCRFCAVSNATPNPPQPDEPQRLANAAQQLNLKHAVITAVARDDLADQGAQHFADCIKALRNKIPNVTIEVLPADFQAKPQCIATVCHAKPDVFNHNLETVQRLTPTIRPQADYKRSLEVLRLVKEFKPEIYTKSGIMVGLGETTEEIHQAMTDLRKVDCQIITVGQYLQPTPENAPIERFYTPDEFKALAKKAKKLGFISVAAAPFVRSSYNAAQVLKSL